MLDINIKKMTTMHSYYFYVSDNFLLRQYYKRNKKNVSKHPRKIDEQMHFEL